MKKSLIALAVLASTTGAFAQSSVTLSGNLDYAVFNSSGDVAAAKGNTVATTTATASTSVINLVAVEDLGGGLKATAKYGLDPRTLANDSLTSTSTSTSTLNGTVVTTTTTTTTNGLARDELYVGLAGGFGSIKLGSPNSIGLDAFLATSPLGTGIGGGYAPNGAGTGANMLINTRYNRSARYDSPSFGGVTLSALYAPGNDQVGATFIANARKTTELGVTYAAGPLAVALVNVSQAAQTNGAGALAGAAKTSTTVLGGQFTFAATTLYAAYFDGETLASSATPTKANGFRLAVKQVVGPVALIGSYQDAKAKDSNPTVHDKVLGLRADYNLSKTTVAYVGFQNWDSFAVNDTRKLTAVGLRKSF